jgi:hypothetical protein
LGLGLVCLGYLLGAGLLELTPRCLELFLGVGILGECGPLALGCHLSVLGLLLFKGNSLADAFDIGLVLLHICLNKSECPLGLRYHPVIEQLGLGELLLVPDADLGEFFLGLDVVRLGLG